MTNGDFEDFILSLSARETATCGGLLTARKQLMMCAGARLNSLGDIVSDRSIVWCLQCVDIEGLRLIRGISPELGEVIAGVCHGSARELRDLLGRDVALRLAFGKEALFDDTPLLALQQGGPPKVFDGVHRLVGALIEGRTTIWAWIGTLEGPPSPECEPHVVYDLLRSYLRGNRDGPKLVAALVYLRQGYSNVDALLENEFSGTWGHNEELQSIVGEALSVTLPRETL